MVIPKTGKNRLDSLAGFILGTLGYEIPPGGRRDKICIAELVLATLYLLISLVTFRAVGFSVFCLGVIWGLQVSLSLFRTRKEEQERSMQFIRKNRLDDTVEIRPPADRRILMIATLFFGLVILLVWNYLMTLLSAETAVSATVWDWTCSIIYICAYTEQMIEILIALYGAQMYFPVVLTAS